MARTVLRRVRRDYTAGDQVGFRTKSFTRGCNREYQPVLDCGTGEYNCDCPDHQFRHSFCKHLRRAAAQLLKSGELDLAVFRRMGVKCCHVCFRQDGLHAIVAQDGTPIENLYTCAECAEAVREFITQRERKAASIAFWRNEVAEAAAQLAYMKGIRDDCVIGSCGAWGPEDEQLILKWEQYLALAEGSLEEVEAE